MRADLTEYADDTQTGSIRPQKAVWEDHEYGRHTDLSFNNPEWIGLAQCFGWHGHRCNDSARLQDTLRAAFAETGPSLVVIPVDYRKNALLTLKLGEITTIL